MCIKLYYFLRIIRPLNVIMTGMAVFFGSWISDLRAVDSRIIAAIISAMLICTGGNALNDYFDCDVDKINKPEKLLPSGKVNRQEAFVIWLIASCTGIILSFIAGYINSSIAFITVFLLYIYNRKLKRTVFWGNFTVSVITGFAFLYGGVIAPKKELSLLPAFFSLLFHFGREIIKDLEDKTGDSEKGITTLATQYGFIVSFTFIAVSFGMLSVLTILPFFYLDFSLLYLVIVVGGVDLVLVSALLFLYLDRSKKNLNRLSFILKLDMCVGFLALYFK